MYVYIHVYVYLYIHINILYTFIVLLHVWMETRGTFWVSLCVNTHAHIHTHTHHSRWMLGLGVLPPPPLFFVSAHIFGETGGKIHRLFNSARVVCLRQPTTFSTSKIFGSPKLWWITLNHSESLWITLNYSELLWITLNHSESLWITLHHSESLWITLHHSESLCITLNHSESLCITLNHSQSLISHVWMSLVSHVKESRHESYFTCRCTVKRALYSLLRALHSVKKARKNESKAFVLPKFKGCGCMYICVWGGYD